MEGFYQAETPPPFAVEERRAGARLVLVAKGEIDMATAPVLRAALARAGASGADEVWLDLSAVEFMGSNGIHALCESRQRLAVICPDGPVRRVLKVAAIDREITIHGAEAAPLP